MVAPADVVCLLSIEHYSHLYANGHEYVSELPLIHFEERFDPAVFARVHRNALINVRRIARVGGDDVVRMDNGMNVPLSRRSRGPLLERLKR